MSKEFIAMGGGGDPNGVTVVIPSQVTTFTVTPERVEDKPVTAFTLTFYMVGGTVNSVKGAPLEAVNSVTREHFGVAFLYDDKQGLIVASAPPPPTQPGAPA